VGDDGAVIEDLRSILTVHGGDLLARDAGCNRSGQIRAGGGAGDAFEDVAAEFAGLFFQTKQRADTEGSADSTARDGQEQVFHMRSSARATSESWASLSRPYSINATASARSWSRRSLPVIVSSCWKPASRRLRTARSFFRCSVGMAMGIASSVSTRRRLHWSASCRSSVTTSAMRGPFSSEMAMVSPSYSIEWPATAP